MTYSHFVLVSYYTSFYLDKIKQDKPLLSVWKKAESATQIIVVDSVASVCKKMWRGDILLIK